MTVDVVLHNARIYTQNTLIDGGIAIDNGKIVKVAKEANLPYSSCKIDLGGELTLPGLIDAHVHLRAQLQAYKEDFYSGTAAAVSGGITSVLDMPNNNPVTMDSASLKERMKAARQRILANVGFYSAFPSSLSEIDRIVESGAIAFKLYLADQIGGLAIDDERELYHAFMKIRKLGVPVAVHAEDRETVEAIEAKEKKAKRTSVEAHLAAHKPAVEVKAVRRMLKLALTSKAQIHFCHISSKEALNLICSTRKKGLAVTCEATPHHLFLNTTDLEERGTLLVTVPPLRSREVANELWNSVRNSDVDIIASDHAPHSVEEKISDSVWSVKPGVPGLETLLPLMLTRVNDGDLALGDLVRLTAERPTEIFHLPGCGFLVEGYQANITVVDMHRRENIDASKFHSKAKFSPFDKVQVKGFPTKTFVNGQLVMDEGEIVGKMGIGRILNREAILTQN